MCSKLHGQMSRFGGACTENPDVDDWPRIDFWNSLLGAVETVDVQTGVIPLKMALDYEGDDEKQPDPGGIRKAQHRCVVP